MKNVIDVLKVVFYSLFFLFVFAACEENEPAPNPEPVESESGVFILNQGRWGENNASLSYYDFKTGITSPDITDGTLGDLAEDMIAYGSKLYVVVNGSSRITIFDLNTRLRVKDIDLFNGDQPRNPNGLTSYNGKVYVTTNDGNVVRIDTVSLSQDGITPVGPNPVGIAAVKNKLYVANSGGYLPEYNNTLSIVDIPTFKEEKVLTVGLNPNIVRADGSGNVYLTYRGNYVDDFGGFQKIDINHTVTNIPISANQDFEIVFSDFGDAWIFYYGVTYNPDYTTNNTVGIYSLYGRDVLTTDQFITDGTKINTPYGIGVNHETGDVYIADTDYSSPSTVYIFDLHGKKKQTLSVGFMACKFVFK